MNVVSKVVAHDVAGPSPLLVPNVVKEGKQLEVVVQFDNEEIDAEWDEGSKLWSDQRDEVLEVLEAKRIPSKEADLLWTKGQFDFYYKNCKSYGIDPELETNEVESTEDGMASFMKQGVEDDSINPNV